MQSDTERVRSNALQIITIATIVVGFGLFNTSFQTEAGMLRDLLKGDRLDWQDHGLIYLKVFAGVLVVGEYMEMLLRARRLFVQTGLSGRDLVERPGSPFRKLILLAALTFLLFIFNQVSNAAGQQ